jgi:prevent-host-death family protein
MARASNIQRILRPRKLRRTHEVSEQVQGSKTINATRAKNAFGEIMESVRMSVPVFIEKHGKAEAVVLNVGHYRTLVRQARTPDEVLLDGLREDFESLYMSMQGDKSRKAVDSLLSASAEDFNKTAAERARTRG